MHHCLSWCACVCVCAGKYTCCFEAQGFRWDLHQEMAVPLQAEDITQLPDQVSVSCATTPGFQLHCCVPSSQQTYTATWSPQEGGEGRVGMEGQSREVCPSRVKGQGGEVNQFGVKGQSREISQSGIKGQGGEGSQSGLYYSGKQRRHLSLGVLDSSLTLQAREQVFLLHSGRY